jgi:hypothetical protein
VEHLRGPRAGRNPTDIIGVTVGSNRYAWLVTSEFPSLASDNARRVEGAQTGELLLSVANACPDVHVTVTPVNTINVTVELVGVNAPIARCIRFVTSSCASFTDVTLPFTDHDANVLTPVRATAAIAVPCGVFTSLCAKDRQHTQWGSARLLLTGVTWTATSVISLDGGDTDDDGDVDINDVTWFLSQFGDLAVAGGCPFNGTSRDADFSNNGAIASEDYAFLVANWLTTSGCACALTYAGTRDVHLAGSVAVSGPALEALDLNADGTIDADDVQLFETRHGLPDDLSRRMRATQR